MSSPYLAEFEEMWLALKPHRPIAFGTRLARITGHPKDAMLLSQLIYWTRRGRDVGQNGGWTHKTREHWFIETGLSREEQENARRRLRARNLVAEWRGGRPACLHYRVEVSAISTAIRANCRLVGRLPWSIETVREDEYAAQELLGPTVAFRRVFVDLVGNVNAALLLSRMVQLQRGEADRQCTWFTLTATEWQRTLGLNRRQLENAKNRLKGLGLIRELTRVRTGKRVYTQVNATALHAQMVALASRPATRDVLATRRNLLARRMPVEDVGPLPVTRSNRPSGDPSIHLPAVAASPNSPTRSLQLQSGVSRLLPSAGLILYRWRETYVPNARAYMRITYSITTTTGSVPLSCPPPCVVVGSCACRSGGIAASPGDALVWPERVHPDERQLIAEHLSRVPAAQRQVLLDEMAVAHRRQGVQLPVAYIGGLVRRYLAGAFVPAKAHLERAARERAAARADGAVTHVMHDAHDASEGERSTLVSTRETAHRHLAVIRERLRGQIAQGGACHA